MYVIITYDVSVERVNKVCQFLRQYLDWVQNSVFEGELTESQLVKIRAELKKMIDKTKDSVRIYSSQPRFITREIIGRAKAEPSSVI